MLSGQSIDKGQAEAGTPARQARILRHLFKRLAEAGDVFLGNSGTVVAHFQAQIFLQRGRDDLDSAFVAAEFRRIGEEIQQYLS